jgi:hypothetical protein
MQIKDIGKINTYGISPKYERTPKKVGCMRAN